MKPGMLLLALLFVTGLSAQTFPQSFIGHWKGELQWYRQGKAEPQRVAMQFIVQPTDTAGQYTWQLVYGEKNEDNRPYLLKAVDSAKGHWLVDERNGILLDQYWTGQRLNCAFAVQGTTIVNSYWLEGDQLMIEFFSMASAPVRNSGSGTEASPEVNSYAFKGFQRASLKKQ